MPLPDENKGKSARDLIARFQSNINVNSEAPLKPRHSFGSNERLDGANGGPDTSSDISEAKRPASDRINKARASLDGSSRSLLLSRSRSTSSASLSSSGVQRPRSSLSAVTRQENDTDIEGSQTKNENAPDPDGLLASQSALGDTSPKNSHATMDKDAPRFVVDQETSDGKDGKLSPKDSEEASTSSTRLASSLQDEKQSQLVAPETPEKTKPSVPASPGLSAPTSSLATSASESQHVSSPSSNKVSTTPTKTPAKAPLARTRALVNTKNSTSVAGTTAISPSISASKSSTSPSTRLVRASGASATKDKQSSGIEAAARSPTVSRSALRSSTPSKTARPGKTADAATSSSKTASRSTTATPQAPSLSSRRIASEDSSSTETGASAKARQQGLSAIGQAKVQSASATSPTPTKSPALAKSRNAAHIPPSPRVTSTPTKSPSSSRTKAPAASASSKTVASSVRTSSPASTSPSDTLARLMRPTIASQAHSRASARSPGTAPLPTTSSGPNRSATSSPSLAKTRTSVALSKPKVSSTASAGTRAKVRKETIASPGHQGRPGSNKHSLSERANSSKMENVEETLSNSEQVPDEDTIPEIPTEEGDLVPAERIQGAASDGNTQTADEVELDRSTSAPANDPVSTDVNTTSAVAPSQDEKTASTDSATITSSIEKVVSGFGPNRPYGKIGLPVEEATSAEEEARGSVDEENRILPPHLKIKEPVVVNESMAEPTSAESASKYGSREGSPLPPKSPAATSTTQLPVKSATSMPDSGPATPTDDAKSNEQSAKKVPIWMRKGGE